MAASGLHEVECRLIPEVWPNIGSYFVTVFKLPDNILSHKPIFFTPLLNKHCYYITDEGI